MNKKNKIIIGSILAVLFIIIIIILNSDNTNAYYNLLCENSRNLYEYTNCINLENKINGIK